MIEEERVSICVRSDTRITWRLACQKRTLRRDNYVQHDMDLRSGLLQGQIRTIE